MNAREEVLAEMLLGCIALVGDTHELMIEKGLISEADVLARLRKLESAARREKLPHMLTAVRIALRARMERAMPRH